MVVIGVGWFLLLEVVLVVLIVGVVGPGILVSSGTSPLSCYCYRRGSLLALMRLFRRSY
jgi:hypothetical protein